MLRSRSRCAFILQCFGLLTALLSQSRHFLPFLFHRRYEKKKIFLRQKWMGGSCCNSCPAFGSQPCAAIPCHRWAQPAHKPECRRFAKRTWCMATNKQTTATTCAARLQASA